MKAFVADPGLTQSSDALTFASLPIIEDDQDEPGEQDEDLDDDLGGHAEELAMSSPKKKNNTDAIHILQEIPELASLGRVFRSTKPVPLTESETEYVVECVKHIFEDHVVVQFLVQNTLDDQRLDNVTVSVETEPGIYEVTGEIAAEHIKYGDIGNCFAVVERNTSESITASKFSCEMKFAITQIDPATGEEEGEPYDEEYPLEELEVTASDYMARVAVPDFRAAWESMGNDNEVLSKFALEFKTQEAAVTAVIAHLGMQPCDGTGTVKPGGKPHLLHLSGVFVGGRSVLARAQVSLQQEAAGVIFKIAVRSEDKIISEMVTGCIV